MDEASNLHFTLPKKALQILLWMDGSAWNSMFEWASNLVRR
jgi:hypothetical protein